MIKELMRRIGRLVAIACLPVMALVAPAGRAEAEIVVTFPQAPISPFENAAPVAQAFYFTEGGLVFLTGRNSFDDDEDRLFYEWTQIDGPQVTLASADEVEANFPKPILTQGDEPITYTFSLTVSDGVAEDEEEVIVTIFPPRVIREPQAVAKVVGKTPEDGVYTVTGGETVTLTAEDSIGFGKQEPAYLWQTESPGIALSAEEGVTTSFVAPVVTAPTEVTVQLTLGVILDISRASPSLVSPIEDDAFTTLVRVKVVPAGNKDAEAKAAKQRVQKFVQSRMSLLLANQPDFVLDVLGGSASNGSANLNVSSMGGQADFATAPGQPVWLRLKGSWSTVDGAEGDYILGSVGAQVVAGDGYALGVMAQVDHMKTVDGLAVAEGTGVMAGPYAVVRLKTMPVTVQGRLLYGTTANTMSPLGTFQDSFDGDRLMAQLGLSGEVLKGDVTWKPMLNAGYVRETTEAYVDGTGTPVAAQDNAMAQITPGVEVSFPVEVSSGSLRLTLGAADVWSGSLSGAAASYEGHRGRVSAGVTRNFGPETALSATAIYDGIGMETYESLSLDLLFEHRF